MSFQIEQNKEEVKRAYSVQSRADIASVRIVDSRALCRERFEDIKSPLSFSIKFDAEDATVAETRLTVGVRFRFTARGKESPVVVAVGCRIQADYRLAEGFQPSEDELVAFKTGNAIFNCWPYFREFVQSAVTRMGYPPPTVPFLRLVPRKEVPPEMSPKAEVPHIDATPQTEEGQEGRPIKEGQTLDQAPIPVARPTHRKRKKEMV